MNSGCIEDSLAQQTHGWRARKLIAGCLEVTTCQQHAAHNQGGIYHSTGSRAGKAHTVRFSSTAHANELLQVEACALGRCFLLKLPVTACKKPTGVAATRKTGVAVVVRRRDVLPINGLVDVEAPFAAPPRLFQLAVVLLCQQSLVPAPAKAQGRRG